LIDLSGHTAGNRLLTFALKPAPLQASWIGYPGTTGLRTVDYYIADRHFLPVEEFSCQFTEKLVFLPALAPFLPHEAAPPVNSLPALSNGYITFGSFNRLSKLRPSVIALWSRLLHAIPGSRMLLGGMPPEGQYTALIDWFAAEGINPARLDFRSRCGTEAYMALHHEVDMCLDAFPYTGGTTTAHALWMGVPTLTLAGPTAPSRQGAAILSHAGLAEFVAHDAAQFEQKGLFWAANIDRLAQLRFNLRSRCDDSAMHRPDLIAAGLENALRKMWQRWCQGLPPEAFESQLPAKY
jgi:predicted O-linked N-acetylglucosamine transferase (SPINDLY family)